MGKKVLPAKLMRNYFLVKMPIKKPSIELTEAAEREFYEEQMEKTTKLEVVIVAEGCQAVKTGDVVRLKPGAFLSGEVYEKEYVLFQETDVTMIY